MLRILALLLASTSCAVVATGTKGIDTEAINQIMTESTNAVRRLQDAFAKAVSANAPSFKNMVQTDRRLTDTSMCEWASGKCKAGTAWMTAQANTLADQAFKDMATKAMACEAITVEATCIADAKCGWQAGLCEYKMGKAESEMLMGKVFSSTGCGFTGKMMELALTCSTIATCSSNSNCAQKQVFTPSTDGTSCAAAGTECAMDESKTEEMLCPGKSMETITPACLTTQLQTDAQACMTGGGTQGACTGQMMNAMLPCIKAQCAEMGEMMEAMMPHMLACQTSMGGPSDMASCNAKANCAWKPASGGDSAKCDMDESKMMDLLIPNSCSYKAVVAATTVCGATTQATCTDAKCQWVTQKECASAVSTPTDASQCEIKGDAMMTVMAEGTDNADMKVFARVSIAESQCKAITAEGNCGSQAAPVFATRALPNPDGASAVSAANHVGSGILPVLLACAALLIQ